MALGYLRWLAQLFVHEKVREATATAQAQVEEAIRGRSAPQEIAAICDAAVIFALGSESGCFEDLLSGLVTLKGRGFKVHQGELGPRKIAVAVSGAGRKAAAHATEAVLSGHRPPLVISAGFCGGLVPELRRHDLVAVQSVVDEQGNRIDLDLPFEPGELAGRQTVMTGTLLTVDAIVDRPEQKRQLGQTRGAIAVDLETFAVAQVCRERGVPCLGIRIVSDAVDEELPREVAGLVRQRTNAARWGAALASIWNRPGSIKDMLRLKENALTASDLLAKYLAQVIRRAGPLPPAKENH